MSSEYSPDYWVMIKVKASADTEVHYRILAGWAGSYLYGTSWKISSGVEDIELIETEKYSYYRSPQTSGSVYLLSTVRERLGSATGYIFEHYKKQAEAEKDVVFEIVPIEEVLKNIKCR